MTDTLLVLNNLAAQIHDNTISKGFVAPGQQRPVYQHVALIVSELGELVEASRASKSENPIKMCDKPGLEHLTAIEEEFADTFIRVLDFASEYSLNLKSVLDKMAYNSGRPIMHGKAY